MGAALHVMLSVDPETLTGVCRHCGPVGVKRGKNAKGEFRYICREGLKRYRNTPAEKAGKARYRERYPERVQAAKLRHRRPHRFHVGETCSRCGFVPEHMAQLDVHHIDMNHSNNEPENLQTLCANCHRLVHQMARKAA